LILFFLLCSLSHNSILLPGKLCFFLCLFSSDFGKCFCLLLSLLHSSESQSQFSILSVDFILLLLGNSSLFCLYDSDIGLLSLLFGDSGCLLLLLDSSNIFEQNRCNFIMTFRCSIIKSVNTENWRPISVRYSVVWISMLVILTHNYWHCSLNLFCITDHHNYFLFSLLFDW